MDFRGLLIVRFLLSAVVFCEARTVQENMLACTLVIGLILSLANLSHANLSRIDREYEQLVNSVCKEFRVLHGVSTFINVF